MRIVDASRKYMHTPMMTTVAVRAMSRRFSPGAGSAAGFSGGGGGGGKEVPKARPAGHGDPSVHDRRDGEDNRPALVDLEPAIVNLPGQVHQPADAHQPAELVGRALHSDPRGLALLRE